MMLNFPKSYSPLLDLNQTEKAIRLVKDFFEKSLAAELRLKRVSPPALFRMGTGMSEITGKSGNSIVLQLKSMENEAVELVQSLSKWNRSLLAKIGTEKGFGVYSEIRNIKPEAEIENTQAVFTDLWEWERVISGDERNLAFLREMATAIFSMMRQTEFILYDSYPKLKAVLPTDITFFQSEEMLKMYPALPAPEREYKLAQKYGAIFVIGIGGKLSNKERHAERTPEIDDWSTPTNGGYKGLNGDLIIWNPILKNSMKIAELGIRVDPESLVNQLKLTGNIDLKELSWQKSVISGEFPLSVGGSINQSALCMFLLKKVHIGEVLVGIWPQEVIDECAANHCPLL